MKTNADVTMKEKVKLYITSKEKLYDIKNSMLLRKNGRKDNSYTDEIIPKTQ